MEKKSFIFNLIMSIIAGLLIEGFFVVSIDFKKALVQRNKFKNREKLHLQEN